jgi:NADH-quinone oxidoreductase subunit L
VFPLSGFFSKDEIIDNVGHNGYTAFMIVGLSGAFLTAAYMTRATYLTFFGEARGAAAGEHHDEHDAHAAHDAHDDHGAHAAHDTHGAHDAHGDHGDHGPHESPKLITIPLIILAALALVAGLANATPFGSNWENFKKYVEPSSEYVMVESAVASGPGESIIVPAAEEGAKKEGCAVVAPEEGMACYFPTVSHAKFKWSKAALSLFIVAVGLVSSWLFCVQYYTRRNRRLVGLTERNIVLRGGYKLLWNKYYLDALYEKVIVRAVAYPIARAAYWFNQNVLDGIVNAAGKISRRVAGWVYRNIDQRVVDGAVNGSGAAARGTGGALRPVQSGKVNQYGALLFAAAAIGALILVIINT